MKRNLLLLFFILMLAVLALVMYFWGTNTFAQTVNAPEDNVLIGLIGTENPKSPVYLLFIYLEKTYVHVYQIPPKVKTKTGNMKKKMIDAEDLNVTSRNLKRILNIHADFHIMMNSQGIKKIIHAWGGVEFFNQHSTALPKGRVFIDSKNYERFLVGVEEDTVRMDLAYSIWYNLLLETFYFYFTYATADDLVQTLIENMDTDLKTKQFSQIVSRFLSHLDDTYVSYSRMNLEFDGEDFLPFQSGIYDQGKFADLIEGFKTRDKSIEHYPITLQVKNTTQIKRLAAKTAGILRRKKCNVKEYLNSDVDLNESLILDRSGSSIKKEYLKKITKVENVIYLIDHREQFDFTLYIGDDYYAIKDIR